MSVFSEEWRACLREQYKHVIRENDQVTLPSLMMVMERVGFSEDDLAQLRVEATMRIEDVADDFVPDLEILQPAMQPTGEVFQPHPLECQCPQCVDINLVPHDEDGQPLSEDEQQELLERQQHEADDDDNPQQMSMF